MIARIRNFGLLSLIVHSVRAVEKSLNPCNLKLVDHSLAEHHVGSAGSW